MSIPPVSERAYVVFVKAWALGPKTPADVAQAVIDRLDGFLLSLAEIGRWYPSPYGGAISVDAVADAMAAAKDLISSLSEAGVEVSVAVGRGRLDRVLNVGRWNVTALAMNRVARMASLAEARGRVLVDPIVQCDAILSGLEFQDHFGPETHGRVKRTDFTYHWVKAAGFQPSQPVASMLKLPTGSIPTADIVCFDIERYSEKSDSEQNTLVANLSTLVERAVMEFNCNAEDFGPAGDGGYIVFLQGQYHTAPLTWRFASRLANLARAAQIPLRLGISTGPVRRSKERAAVGGAILRADAISSLPLSGEIAVAEEFWSELPDSLKDGWHVREDFSELRASALSRTPPPQPPNPRAFYTGGPASDADIDAGLDVPRTQYVSAWTDEHGRPQPPWRQLLLRHPSDTPATKIKIRVIALYGHRGSGKTTLCRRMIHELRAASIRVVDLLGFPLSLAVHDVVAASYGEQPEPTHVFIEIDDLNDVATLNDYASLLKHLSQGSGTSVVYVGMDTNKWQQIESRIRVLTRSLGGRLEGRHLRGSLDEWEVRQLIQRLKAHGCLFRLEHKTDASIVFAFHVKAKRGLLTSLIEATRGTEAAPDLASIIWDEYSALPRRAQWAYFFVAMFHASVVLVPRHVLERALVVLLGDRSYFASQAFVDETKEIIFLGRHGEYVTRHPLIAETLMTGLSGPDWQGLRYRTLRAALEAIDPSTNEDRLFFDSLNERKLLRCLSDPAPLVEEVANGAFPAIRGRYTSQFLNGAVRIYQGRRRYASGEGLATTSLERWDHVGNQATYLRAFCQQNLGKSDEVRRAVDRLLAAEDFPYHVLHAITLLTVLRDWTKAKKALDRFLELHSAELWRFEDYENLRHKVDVFSQVHWVDRPLDSMAPSQALERIQILFENTAEENMVIEQYQALVRRAHNFFGGFVAFFAYLLRWEGNDEARLERLDQLAEECRYHIGRHEGHYSHYPNDVLSLLHTNLARSLFAMDYIGAKEYPHQAQCAEHFHSAIRLKSDNWYAHNWYGTFLKEVKADRPAAESHYRQAVSGDQHNPVFKLNLALLLYEEGAFGRARLMQARDLAAQALAQCQEDAKWKSFADFPEELLGRLTVLLSRTDISEGEGLDPDNDLPRDAG